MVDKSLEEISNKMIEYGSANWDDTGFPIKEDGYYIIQNIHEYPIYLNKIIEHFANTDKNQLEKVMFIGVGGGGEVKLFTDFVKCKNVITIDNGEYQEIFKHWERNRGNINCDLLIDFLEPSTKPWFNEYLRLKFKEDIDFIMIDGDHTDCGIRNDIEIATEVLKKEGLMVLHDTNLLSAPEGVNDELIYKNPYFELLFEVKIYYGLSVFKRV